MILRFKTKIIYNNALCWDIKISFKGCFYMQCGILDKMRPRLVRVSFHFGEFVKKN